jgi:AcrR family transcriptional regulator
MKYEQYEIGNNRTNRIKPERRRCRVKAAMSRSAGQKDRILAFARELFFHYGFTRVTIDEISAALHISKTTFYRYFKSKEDLLAEVIRTYYRKIRDGISDIMAHGAGGYLEELKKVMRFIGEMLEHIDARARQDIRAAAPGVWKTLQELQHRMVHSVLEKILEKGMGTKIVRRDINARKMAQVLVMTLENALDGEALRALSLSIEEAFDTLINVFLDGILHDRQKSRS